MSFSHRRLLLLEDEKSKNANKYDCDLCFLNRDCPDQCKKKLDDQVFPISPPPLIPTRKTGNNSNMPTILILMLCVLGAAFVFLCYLTVLKKYRSNLSSSSRRRRRRDSDTDAAAAPAVDNRRGNWVDENHGHMMIHPIWYINTVGLQQSVIDSIAVFRYKKGESLIESGDCSVCLSEFEEDEILRVLPKCSHAFHIDCIDTWLRSHKNCPLCRAPIVRESIILEAEEEESVPPTNNNNNNSASPENSSAVGDDDDEVVLSDHRHSSSTTNLPEIGVENITDSTTGTSVDKSNDGIRVLSDLSDHHRRRARRSISMDAKIPPPVMQEEEDELELKKQNSDKVTAELMIIHKHNKSRKSFSFGRSLQKMPIRMKRSFSSSSHSSNSKSSSLSRNRNGRSQEIIQSF